MSQPQKQTISLIIPTDRADDALRCCLAGASKADPPPDEVIVVVDGGDEAARTLAASFGAMVTQTPVRAGPAGARNVGARLARSDILLFIVKHPFTRPRTERGTEYRDVARLSQVGGGTKPDAAGLGCPPRPSVREEKPPF
jgi:cellulose synthase/poly-beta-1,6-N-acetylglucosamine synthase-like glycosyltransferase